MFWGHKSEPPFQIDANFGFTAAILEMLVFSVPGRLKLLPALPDAWVSGKFENILCRGGISVSTAWNTAQKNLNVRIESTKTQRIEIKFPWPIKDIRSNITSISLTQSDTGGEYFTLTLTENQPLEITV